MDYDVMTKKFIFGPDYEKMTKSTPSPILWEQEDDYYNVIINNFIVASLEKRPAYCDRGHFYVKCFLPYMDESDSFPRYYMNEDVARSETEAFLKWRIWKIKVPHVKEESHKGKNS